MANYIDKDKLFIYLASMRFESNLDKAMVLDELCKLPTTNVVPRAEVAKIFDEIESWDLLDGIVAKYKFAELRKKYESEGADDNAE